MEEKYNVLYDKENDIEKKFNIAKKAIQSIYGDHTEPHKINYFELFKHLTERNDIKNFSKELKEEFKKLNLNDSSHPFQCFGDNIRKSGDPLDEKNFNTNNSYLIADIIHNVINAKIEDQKEANSKEAIRIAIDSIRNSMEARYFKEKYPNFYLFAINTEESYRKIRQHNIYNDQELKILDKEYTSDLEVEQKFYRQDIQTCIQVADIYLHNPNEPTGNGDRLFTLKCNLLRYLSLILHPGIITPTPEERCMQIAYTAKYNSGCISRQVGAIVTDSSFSVKSIGWNSTAEGQTPCLLRNAVDLVRNSDQDAFSEYEKSESYKALVERAFFKQGFTNSETVQKLNGRNISFCFKDGKNCLDGYKNQVHTRSLHAEENAMIQISKYGGEGIKGGYLFTTASPCELCSKKAYQLGIRRIYFIDPYPGISTEQILKSGTMDHQPETNLFVGAIGRAYHQLFEPFMPYKDELKTLLGFSYTKSDEEEPFKRLQQTEVDLLDLNGLKAYLGKLHTRIS